MNKPFITFLGIAGISLVTGVAVAHSSSEAMPNPSGMGGGPAVFSSSSGASPARSGIDYSAASGNSYSSTAGMGVGGNDDGAGTEPF